jgi:hypothetical protein
VPVSDPADEIKERLERAAAEQALKKVSAEVSAFGHGLLDAIEGAVFGQKGGADEVLAEQASRGSALDRARQKYGVGEGPAPAPVGESAEAKAARIQAKLDALKAAKSAPPAAPPKKTL